MTNIVERIAESLKDRGVSLSYGEKVMVDGKELVPVAFVTYGFGGGDDAGDGDEGSSAGGGGGGMSIPVGAYVGGEQTAVFRPNPVAVLVALIPLVWISGRAIARIVKAF